jgi:argininosuccinate synthase
VKYTLSNDQDFEAAKTKAMKCGAAGFFLEDLKREFVEELIYRQPRRSTELTSD